jgi:hypothetical protein
MRESRGFRFIAAAVAAAVLTLTGMGSAVAVTPPTAEATSGPSIQSDQPDYMPGSTVVLSGAGWQPGEGVHLHVNDDQGATWDYDSDVVAGDDGTITDTFNLPNWFVATYRVTATGAVSGVVTSSFTDGNLRYVSAGANAALTATAYGTNNCTGTATGSGSNGSIGLGQPDVSVKLVAPASVGSAGFDKWSANLPFTVISGTGGTQICLLTTDVNNASQATATANYSTSIGTSTSVQSGANPSTYGDNTTFTASVAATGAAAPTSGTVTFKAGAITVCDSVALNASSKATCQSSSLSAGSHTVTATYAPSGNYSASSGSMTQTVNARTVTGSFTANDKTYDGTVAATIASSALNNMVPGDDVQLTGSATFADPNVGTGKTVTLNNASLKGQAAANYALGNSGAITTTANITPYGLTASFTAGNKVYDGGTDASIIGATVSGFRQGDAVTITPSGKGVFADPNVANGIKVTAPASAFTLGGAQGGNYSITSVTPTTANVTPLHITGEFTAATKTYDATNSATVTGRSLVGAVKSDDVALSGGTATFPDKNVGADRVVTLSGASLAGAAKGNYVLDSVASAKASITPLNVSASFTTANKVYDATDAAAVNNPTLHGILGTDQVNLSGGLAYFNDRNVGTSKPVTAAPGTFQLGGNDAADYNLDSVDATSADITVRDVTVAFSANGKTYDGNNAASIASAAPANALEGDHLGVDFSQATAEFDSSTAGSHSVNASGFALTGADKDNYTIAGVTPTTATIDARHLTATFTAANKVYDRTTDATVSGFGFDDLVAGDVVTLTGTATFDTKNVGAGKTVTLNMPGLGGKDAGNYILDPVATATADITAAGLTPSITVADKVYDGNISATILTRTLDGVQTGDDVSLTGGVATFADKNVGDAKPVTAPLLGFSLSGDDARNYSLGTGNATTTASISKRDLTISFGADDKTYEGGTVAKVNGAAAVNSLEGDAVGVDYSKAAAAFADKNVGTWPVAASGFALTGKDAGNYSIKTVQSTQATISAKPITGSFKSADKVYDGNVSAAATDRALTGTVANDDVALTGGTASFDDKNVGTGKTVTLKDATLTGGDAGNYSLNSVATTTANITQLGITGLFTAADKVWDGTTSATITGRSLNGVLGNDDVQIGGGTATFSDPNVGSAKTVTGTGFSLTGADAGNYELDPTTLTTTASIRPLYSGTGFYAPVNMSTTGTRIWNTIKGGQTVPLKFEIFNATSGVEQTSLSVFGSDATAQAKAFSAPSVSCLTGDASSTDPVEMTTTGGTSLRYDSTAGQFIQNWKTPTAVGSCYAVTLKTVDGTTVGPAYFKITK